MVADVIYLISCSLNGIVPSTERIDRMAASGQLDDAMLRFCRAHEVCALPALALKSAGRLDATWEHELAFDEYKYTLQAAEREAVLNALEEHQIRHMPLKGSVLSGLYPHPVMREMCDSDIFYDEAHTAEMDGIMFGLGYKLTGTTPWDRDFHKDPFLSFEMHHHLFTDANLPEQARYYERIWDMVIPDREGGYGYHFGSNDLYAYVTFHAFKHSGSGFGLRTLADEAVMLCSLKDLDLDRVSQTMHRFGLDEFEARLRSLSSRLFDPALLADDGHALDEAISGTSEVLTAEERVMLKGVATAGAYGTVETRFQNLIRKTLGMEAVDDLSLSTTDKARYVLRRLFPPAEELRPGHPVLGRPGGMALLPGIYALRIARRLTVRRGYNAIEFRELKKASA